MKNLNHIIIILISLLLTQQVLAFGPIGHRLVAELAWRQLNEKTKTGIKKIAGLETMAQLSTWPDLIRSDSKWDHTHQWHYLNVKEGQAISSSSPVEGGRLLESIQEMSANFHNKKLSIQQRKEALGFLIHFLGDMHQPLHIGKAHDQGGNKIEVEWFGQKTNLHALWDEHLIQMQQLSYTELVDWLSPEITDEKKEEWLKGDIYTWAQESHQYMPRTYEFPKTFPRSWEYKYSYTHWPELKLMLQKASVRLASILSL